MLLPNPTSQSPPPRLLLNMMAFCSASQPVTEPCLPNGRYVPNNFQLFKIVNSLHLATKSFWDATGQLWAKGALAGKYAGFFVSTAGLGGGQETTVLTSLSTLAHHGIIYVPLGYAPVFGQLSNIEEVHGGTYFFVRITLHISSLLMHLFPGSPWGAGTVAGPNGIRQPSPLELEVASAQGKTFWETIAKTKKD